MGPKKYFFWYLFAITSTCCAVDISDVVVIILSQENVHHSRLAESLRDDLKAQSQEQLTVHLSHLDFPHVGAWTVLPLIRDVFRLHADHSTWILFVEERTNVSISNLLHVLNKYDEREAIFLGCALHDHEPTIIHHFAFYDDPTQFQFPYMPAGIAFTTTLLASLAARLDRQDGMTIQSEFAIDSAHELALFVWDKGNGPKMQHDDLFCAKQATTNNNCATFPNTFQQCQNHSVPVDSVYFAVKTCQKFHKDRVPIVQKTWGRFAKKIAFFSDFPDDSIPTVSLGLPNVEQGHCSKTLAIVQYFYDLLEGLPEVRWLVIADDDTILSVQSLCELLRCYNSSSSVAVGERYGYNVHNAQGYNYITGGGGMVFSKVLVQTLIEDGNCKCPSLSTPDDMFLGLCLASLGVSVTHSPRFHQARPVDYPSEYLEQPVSFHKHWMIDPVKVYEEWFGETSVEHDEL